MIVRLTKVGIVSLANWLEDNVCDEGNFNFVITRIGVTVLGPLLSIVYIYQFSTASKLFTFHMYADTLYGNKFMKTFHQYFLVMEMLKNVCLRLHVYVIALHV